MTHHYLAHDREQLLSQFARSNFDVIPLHVAENILLFTELRDNFTTRRPMVVEDIKYQPSSGTREFNSGIANFLSESFSINPPLACEPLDSEDDNPGQVSSFSGTRCALDVVAQVLFGKLEQPERRVMMPTPCWQGFQWIYEDRLGGEIVDVPLHAPDFELTLEAIQQVYKGTDPKPKALVLTNPHNPLGINYSPALLEEIFIWVLHSTEMHIISDEIYAHCQIDKYDAQPFASALSLSIANDYPDRVHVVWGLAKDFGLSGFRVGVLASRDQELHKKVRRAPLAGFSPMTSSNNWLVEELFQNGAREANELIEMLRPRLMDSFNTTWASLDENDIPYFLPTHSAQFVWLDLRKWLNCEIPDCSNSQLADLHLLKPVDSHSQEERLDNYLACEAEVTLLRGEILSASDPGFFRLCYTAQEIEKVTEAIERISVALDDLQC